MFIKTIYKINAVVLLHKHIVLKYQVRYQTLLESRSITLILTLAIDISEEISLKKTVVHFVIRSCPNKYNSVDYSLLYIRVSCFNGFILK